jgi:xanthine dehydrogenase accessory factor
MSLRPESLARAALRGPFVRVLVAEVRGSAPREAGAQMLVWPDHFEGTIGGGALEWQALRQARSGRRGVEQIALGPRLGQCCGGAVSLVYEAFDRERVAEITTPIWARPVQTVTLPQPCPKAELRPGQARKLVQGWLIEAVAPPPNPVWVWGAGHVGRAIVSVLAPLPELAITWIDSRAEQFPALPADVRQIVAEHPVDIVRLADPNTHHLVLTHAHSLDLELCHRLLERGFASLGLIGSASKAARFAARLSAAGHTSAQISRIHCPIGDPGLGKHPQAIAVGAAGALLRAISAMPATKDRAG